MEKGILISVLTVLVIGVLGGGSADPDAEAMACLARYTAYRQSLIEYRETCLRMAEMGEISTGGTGGGPDTPESRRWHCLHEPDNYCKSARR